MEKKSSQPPAAISWKALLALVLLACLSYPNLLDSRRSIYALCSSEGNKIYTVDKHDTTAQCVVIRKNRIVDVGSLRQSPPSPVHRPSNLNKILHTGSVTSHWGQSRLYRFITRSSLDVRYIPRDATIVPGFSGTVFCTFCLAFFFLIIIYVRFPRTYLRIWLCKGITPGWYQERRRCVR